LQALPNNLSPCDPQHFGSSNPWICSILREGDGREKEGKVEKGTRGGGEKDRGKIIKRKYRKEREGLTRIARVKYLVGIALIVGL